MVVDIIPEQFTVKGRPASLEGEEEGNTKNEALYIPVYN